VPTQRACLAVLVTAITLLIPAMLGIAGCAAPAPPADGDPNVVPFVSASVTEMSPGVFTVGWYAPHAGTISVYAGSDREHIGRDRVVATGGVAETREVTGLPAADRWWFELMPERGRPLVLADRSLHLASAPNFRDLGGYRTRDGRWVKMGELYRSDQLDKLSDEDLAKLGRLGIRTVVDLRTDAERAAGADRVPAGARPVVADVLTGTGTPVNMDAMLAAPTDPTQTMQTIERTMVEAPAAQTAYRSLLTEVAQPDHLPLVFHCTAGKDRTGWGAATVLTALGVPGDVVLNDYLDSNRYVLPKYAPVVAAFPAEQGARARALLEVRPEYLQAGLDAASHYGSMDEYVSRVLGMPPETLRAELLEQP
jgi:protein-tyrosine phosphatase